MPQTATRLSYSELLKHPRWQWGTAPSIEWYIFVKKKWTISKLGALGIRFQNLCRELANA